MKFSIPDSDRLLRRAWVWTLIVFIINFAFLGFIIGPFDYDHLSAYYDLAWRFWREAPGLPQYNPYLCGGRSLGGDPQIPIFYPLTFLIPLLSATWVIKLEMLVQLFFGIYGIRGWLRQLGADESGVRWGALLYVAGGGVVSRYLVGHVTLGFYILMPLFFYLSNRLTTASGKEKAKLQIAYGFLFLYAGWYKPNFLIYGVPPLLVEHAVRAFLKKRPSILINFVAGVILCGLGNAFTYLPANQYFHDFPRGDFATTKWIPPYTLLANLLMPLKSIPLSWYAGSIMARHEFNYFITPMGIFFAFIGLKKLRKQASPELISLVVFLAFSAVLGFGTFESGPELLWPYVWMEKAWPGFKSVRVSVRFWYGVYLALIAFSALGWKAPSTKRAKLALVLLGLLPLLGSMTVNLFKTSVEMRETAWVTPRRYLKDHTWVLGLPDDTYREVRQGVGVLQCLYNMEVFPGKDLRPGNTLDLISPVPITGSAHWIGWNKIAVSYQATPSPTTLTFNLNHSPYWRFEGTGAKLVSRPRENLTLATVMEPVEGVLIFEQPGVRAGALISALTWLAFLVFAGIRVRRVRK